MIKYICTKNNNRYNTSSAVDKLKVIYTIKY